MERKKINSAKNLSEETLNSLLEELNQVANGPELTGAGELDNEATEEKEPTEDTLEKDNKDTFPAEEHEQAEDVEEVVVESNQVAAGPEIEDGEKKLENEATEEKEPTEDALEKENTDVYCDASHNQTEDVEEVVVESSKYTDEQLYKLLEAKGFKKSETNLRIVKEGLDSGRYTITEDGLETEPTVKAAEDAGVASDVPAEDAEATVDEVQEVIDTEVADDEPVKDTDDSISESMKRLFSLIDTINENAQVAAGPEVEDGEKKLDNEATEEKEPSQDSLEKDNTDAFPAEEHEQAEDVKEVVVETQVDNRGVRQVGRKVNPEFMGKTTTADGKTTYQFRGKDFGEDKEAAKAAQDEFNRKHGNGYLVKESEQVAAGPEIEDGEKKLDNEATLEKEPVEDTLEKDNSDVYCNACHDQTEDVEEVEIKEGLNYFFSLDDDEAARLLETCYNENEALYNFLTEAINAYNDEELNESIGSVVKGVAKRIKRAYADYKVDRDTDGEIGKINKAYRIRKAGVGNEAALKYNSEDYKAKKDAYKSAKKKYKTEMYTGTQEQQKARKDAMDNAKKEKKAVSVKGIKKNIKDELKTLKTNATNDAIRRGKEQKEKNLKAEVEKNKNKADSVYDLANPGGKKEATPVDDKNKQKTSTKVMAESEQVAAGPDITASEVELDNEATLEKEPTEAALEKDNRDVYTNMTHDQVEDVVDVVIEALSSCKRDGIVLSNENIKKRATELFEELGVEIGNSVENQYDADADIESSEMNGSDTAFDKVEEIKDEEHFDGPTAEKMQESIKYNSLKEACMLDESYFKSSTYTIQTADEKKEKLTEQVALLAAREAMDPMYDELLKQALYCQRLQEALQNKYSATALNRVSTIISD